MMLCPVCEVDVHPCQELTPDRKIVDTCPRCNMVLGRPGQTSATAEATSHGGTSDDRAKCLLVANTTTADQMVEAANARLRHIEGELQRLSELQAEAELLRRMLSAASANVVPITTQETKAS